MKIDKNDVLKCAKLSRIEILEDEISNITNDLNKIIEFVDDIENVDTNGVEPMNGGSEFNQILRKDEVIIPEDSKDKVLANAKDKNMGFFTVPKVVE